MRSLALLLLISLVGCNTHPTKLYNFKIDSIGPVQFMGTEDRGSFTITTHNVYGQTIYIEVEGRVYPMPEQEFVAALLRAGAKPGNYYQCYGAIYGDAFHFRGW